MPKKFMQIMEVLSIRKIKPLILFAFLTINFFIPSAFKSASAIKIEYIYNDCEDEFHSGAIITLQKNDTNPTCSSMKSNYNKIGAAILRGASNHEQRSFSIKGISHSHIEFARALMKKAYDISEERELPITLCFYDVLGEEQNILSREWETFQEKLNMFYDSHSLEYDSD